MTGLVLPGRISAERCDAAGSGDSGPVVVTRRIRVLHLLVTTSPGGGPEARVRPRPQPPGDEFEVIIAAPRDGVFFDRFWELG